jgi:endonuclease III-like uncharacterized protein
MVAINHAMCLEVSKLILDYGIGQESKDAALMYAIGREKMPIVNLILESDIQNAGFNIN